MPWTGSTFIRDNSAFTGPLVWTDDRDAGTKITSAHHDYHDQDIADGITACINKNGANSPTSDISWGNRKITSLANGSSDQDAAAFGQTVTAADLDPVTNILSLTRSGMTDVTVDLSALALGGSTAPFARLASANVFTDTNTFAAIHITAGNGITWDAGSGSILQWDAYRDNNGFYFFRDALATVLEFPNTGTRIKSFGANIWTENELTTAQVAGMLTTSGNFTITGAYVFTNPNTKLAPHLESSATGGGNWSIGPDSNEQYSWNDPTGLVNMAYIIDPTETSGAYLQVGSKKVWDYGAFRSGLTSAPTGGLPGYVAIVQSGADRGLWTNIANVWTKLIAFP